MGRPDRGKSASESREDSSDPLLPLLERMARPPEAAFAPGAWLGRYRVVALVDRGGMGEVYRAHDERLHRDVAIKVLRSGERANPALQKRFETEAKAVGSLNHPNVVAVFDAGEDNGCPYLVTELLEGETLAQRLRKGALAPGAAVEVALGIARALAAAHAVGVVHRDLKPANVFLTSDGRIKVLDFGLAKWMRAEGLSRENTSPGSLLGTPGYMSPEQARGEPADARSDLFSLGALLYEMLCGTAPFRRRAPVEDLHAILHEDPPPMEASRRGIPRHVQTVVRRCLAKRPDDRFQSARAVVDALAPTAPAASGALIGNARRWLIGTGALLVALGLAALLVGSFRRAPAIHSIAVLSLDNLSSDPSQAYFADGMTEELTTSLARISSLKIISRTSAVQYRGTRKPLKQIARELGVDAIVEGSVSRFGDKVRITAQLIDARTDQHLWAGSYEKTVGEVLRIQNSVAMEITRQVQSKLSASEENGFKRHISVNPEAYEAYLQGRYHLTRQDPEALKKGLAEFQRAIDIDPTYAPAYSGMADTFDMFVNFGMMPPGEAFPRAKAAALKSIELDETLAEPHVSLGFGKHNFDWDWRGAEAEYKRAIELSPSSATAHFRYAKYLSTASRHEQAISEIRKAQELDPLSRAIGETTGRVLYNARRYDEAIKELLQMLELDPNAGYAHMRLGLSYEQKGMKREAIEQYTKAQTLLGWPHNFFLAHLHATAGRRADTVAILREAERQGDWYWVVVFQAVLGNKDAAFDYLERAYDARKFGLCFLDVDPYFDPLRSDPTFAILMRRIGLR